MSHDRHAACGCHGDISGLQAPLLKMDSAMSGMAADGETLIDVTGQIDPSTIGVGSNK